MFADLPLPKQIHWGDRERKLEARSMDHDHVHCIDVVGCRSNFFMERTRAIPVGCPLDQLEPVFDSNGNWRRNLTDFEWLWVDIYEQEDDEEGFQDAPDMCRLYGGPHLYPLATVQFLMGGGFLLANARTLPYGWVPTHTRPAKDLRTAVKETENTWTELIEEGHVQGSWGHTHKD